MDIQIIKSSEDRPRFIEIFNRHMIYAPYTLPLTPDLLENHVLANFDETRQLCLIGRCGKSEGIVHIGLYQNGQLDDGREIGLIYLLRGDTNNMAEALLREAENWFAFKGVTLIRACNHRPNPYKFILHGLETYVWGGSVTTINAFRRLGYDLDGESVIMICKMEQEPEVTDPEIPGISFTVEKVFENDLVSQGVVRASADGAPAGQCSFFYLKAISDYYRKPTGQIAIGIPNAYFGKGLGPSLLLRAHRELFRLGARQVMLHTTQSLFRAIRMYEKIGYVHQLINGYIFSKALERDGTNQ
jgi:hypothetical protein